MDFKKKVRKYCIQDISICLIVDCLLRGNFISKCMLAILCDVGYSSNFFEETRNVRSFGMASLWADIGGYIGMILGLSFLQVPHIASGIFYYIQRKRICSEFQRNSQRSSVDIEMAENQV